MANFNTNRYPWPTIDHAGADAQTGGNTRLLFAEQDNYRTRKGRDAIQKTVKNTSGTSSLVTLEMPIGSSGYLGKFSDGTDANDAASGSTGAENDIYWDTTDNAFKIWDATNSVWVDALHGDSVLLNAILGASITTEIIPVGDIGYRGAFAADSDVSSPQTNEWYFNTTDNQLRHYVGTWVDIVQDVSFNTPSNGDANTYGDEIYENENELIEFIIGNDWDPGAIDQTTNGGLFYDLSTSELKKLTGYTAAGVGTQTTAVAYPSDTATSWDDLDAVKASVDNDEGLLLRETLTDDTNDYIIYNSDDNKSYMIINYDESTLKASTAGVTTSTQGRDSIVTSNLVSHGVIDFVGYHDTDAEAEAAATGATGSITSSELATNTQYHGQYATDAAAATAGGSNLNDNDFYWNTTDNRFKRYLSSAWSNLANNSGVGAFRIIGESATDFVFADLDAIRDGVLANSNAQISIDGGDSIIAYNGGDSKVYQVTAYSAAATTDVVYFSQTTTEFKKRETATTWTSLAHGDEVTFSDSVTYVIAYPSASNTAWTGVDAVRTSLDDDEGRFDISELKSDSGKDYLVHYSGDTVWYITAYQNTNTTFDDTPVETTDSVLEAGTSSGSLGNYKEVNSDDSDVSSPVVHDFHYNTSTSTFRQYDGTDWTDIVSPAANSNASAYIFGSGTYDNIDGAKEEFDNGTVDVDDFDFIIDYDFGYLFYDVSTNSVRNIVAYHEAFASDDIELYESVMTSDYIVTTRGEILVSGVSDLFYVIPRVVSADIAETTENIPIEFLKGSLSANKAQAGAQTYGNGFSIAASEEGLHLFLRTLCNARSRNISVETRKGSDTDGEVTSPRRDILPENVLHVDGQSLKTVTKTAINFAVDIEAPRVVQLEVTASDIDQNSVVELQIDGYDHSGEELREIMLLTAKNNTTPKTTDFYFAQPPIGKKKTRLKVNKPAISGNLSIDSVDRWTQVSLTQQDDFLLPGWTIEVRKGTIPFTYVGVSPNEASIALSRDTALQLDVTTIAFDSLPYTDMGGKRVNLDTGEGSEGIDIADNPAKGDLDFVDASETLFTGWQAYLDITEPGTARQVRVPLTDATFSINHQLDQAQLIVGDRRPGPAFRGTLRDVMLDGTILFTRERDWVKLFRRNTDFRNPTVVLRNAPAGGFPYELHIELGIGQLMSSPDPQVSDLGLITQAFNMKFRESASGKSDDFSFKIVTDKWVFSDDNNTLGGLRVDGVYK